jgi:hypothetical protein
MSGKYSAAWWALVQNARETKNSEPSHSTMPAPPGSSLSRGRLSASTAATSKPTARPSLTRKRRPVAR